GIQRHRAARGSQHDKEIAQPKPDLCVREIQFGSSGLIKTGVFDVSHDPHYRAPLVLISRAHATANRASVSVKGPRHALIYANNRLRARSVTLVQQAALDQANPHSIEIAGRYSLPEVYILNRAVRTNGQALDLSVISVDAAYGRKSRNQRSGPD